MTTGQRIRETRLKRNKTMVDLAQAIDVSPTTISKYEANMIHNMINSIKSQIIWMFLFII